MRFQAPGKEFSEGGFPGKCFLGHELLRRNGKVLKNEKGMKADKKISEPFPSQDVLPISVLLVLGRQTKVSKNKLLTKSIATRILPT